MNFFSLFKRNILYKLKSKLPIDKDNFENKSLDYLFNYYGSDKADYFRSGNREGHGYSIYYTKYLENLKNSKINILEIGSYAGSSAAAFVKYFQNSKVFCLDINISNFKYKSKNIQVYGLDIKNKPKLKSTLDYIFKLNNICNFDIIIDDGSHNLKDILIAFNFFYKYLNKKGYYVIEDFKHPNYYKYNKDLDHIFVDTLLNNIAKKKFFKSSIFSQIDQKYLFENIKEIIINKGNLRDSDICFIKRH